MVDDYVKTYAVAPDQKQLFVNDADKWNCYKAVFEGSSAGERVLKDMLHEAGFFRSSFNIKSSEQTAFNEGKKQICRGILEKLLTTITTTKEE